MRRFLHNKVYQMIPVRFTYDKVMRITGIQLPYQLKNKPIELVLKDLKKMQFYIDKEAMAKSLNKRPVNDIFLL